MSKKRSANEPKKVIYILGCGRSGTTVTGFILGNGNKCLDLGEVIYFLRTKGQPNEFDQDTHTGKFWKSVRQGVQHDIPTVFDADNISDLSHLESYPAFLRLYFGLFPRKRIRAYDAYINSLYDNIIRNSNDHDFYVDSSKAAGRALLYLLLLKKCDVYLLHLIRSPTGVVESFRAKGKQPGNSGFVMANFYYFAVQLFSLLVRMRAKRSRYLKVRYEELQKDSGRILGQISDFAGLDLSSALEKIMDESPLARGDVFNGNRLRMNDRVVFLRTEKTYDKSLGNRITNIINGCWY